MDDLRKRIPQKHKNAWILGAIGAAVGGGIGGYFSALAHNYIYSGIGALIGYAVGVCFALIFWKRINTILLLKSERIFNIFLSLIGFFAVVASVIVFVKTRDKIAVMGFIFFTFCTGYLIWKLRE